MLSSFPEIFLTREDVKHANYGSIVDRKVVGFLALGVNISNDILVLLFGIQSVAIFYLLEKIGQLHNAKW